MIGMDSFTQRYGLCARTLYEESLDVDKRLRKTKAANVTDERVCIRLQTNVIGNGSCTYDILALQIFPKRRGYGSS